MSTDQQKALDAILRQSALPIGSDVNELLFSILPRLEPGVFVHFHDVPYPFEYPEEWVEYGFAWNEAYLLHAFLQYNSDFRVRLWTDYVQRFHGDLIQERMPMCTNSVGFGVGGSIWIERVSENAERSETIR